MTFYGESMGISDVWVLSGSHTVYGVGGVYSGISDLGDGVTVTLVAGDSIVVGCYDTQYLSDTDLIGEVKWVIRASGSGVIDLADARDSNWDGPHATFAALPSLTVSSGTLATYGVTASSGLADPYLLTGETNGGEEIDLRLTVVSGTVTFDQVCLHIDPSVGTEGGHWSDWTTGVLPWEGLYPYSVKLVQYKTDPQEPTFQAVTNIYAPAWDTSDFGTLQYWDPNGSYPKWVGIICYVASNWVEQRPKKPPDLLAMSEGTDYVRRPGYTYENNSYVEYESGPNVITGWRIPDLDVYVYNTIDGGVTPVSGSSWNIELFPNIGVQVVGDQPVFPTPGTGVLVYSSGATASKDWGAPYVAVNNVNGAITSLGVFGSDANYGAGPVLPASPAQFDGRQRFVSGTPLAQVILPRYRYWVPGSVPVHQPYIPPLRQRSRNDGLTTDTKQQVAHDSSSQRVNQWWVGG